MRTIDDIINEHKETYLVDMMGKDNNPYVKSVFVKKLKDTEFHVVCGGMSDFSAGNNKVKSAFSNLKRQSDIYRSMLGDFENEDSILDCNIDEDSSLYIYLNRVTTVLLALPVNNSGHGWYLDYDPDDKVGNVTPDITVIDLLTDAAKDTVINWLFKNKVLDTDFTQKKDIEITKDRKSVV